MVAKKVKPVIYCDTLVDVEEPLIIEWSKILEEVKEAEDKVDMNKPSKPALKVPVKLNVPVSLKLKNYVCEGLDKDLDKDLDKGLDKDLMDKRANKLSFYNQFIKDKRAELIALNPTASKGVIYEMAKQAYRDIKCNTKVGKET